MFAFERKRSGTWQRRGSNIPIVVGRAGLAWGRGLVSISSPGPIKIEGDDKAPAGAFRIGKVFGRAPRPSSMKMPYLMISPHVVAVDDSRSRYYNRIIDQSKIAKRDWRSAEKMFEVPEYKWGVAIEHNISAKPGAGSCIFLHVWKDPWTATSGCTAMSEQNLVPILQWLDMAMHPILVQMPRTVYEQLRHEYQLPQI